MKPFNNENIKEYYKNKYPETKDNYVGIEIECFGDINPDLLAYIFYQNNIQASIDEDSSIETEGHEYDYEIKLCVKEKDYKKIVNKVCNILKKLDIKVNDTCGLHVHLDMRNRKVDYAYTKLVNSIPRLKKYVALHRLDNDYCQLNKTNCFTDSLQRAMYTGDREAINVIAYNKHETLECRLHEGTVDNKKINKWIALLLKTLR